MPANRIAFASAVTVTAICAGIVIGVFALPRPLPDALKPASDFRTINAIQSPYDDSREVAVRLNSEPGLTLTIGAAGVVTSTSCLAGIPIRSGSLVAAIDGIGALALALEVPLFRDVEVGYKGPDVEALNAELTRLGHPVDSTERFDWQSVRALKKLFEQAGEEFEGPMLPRSRVVWLPSPEIVPTACLAPKGSMVETNAPIAQTPGVLKSVVVDLPAKLVPGDRLLDFEGITGPLDETGSLNDVETLRALSLLPTIQGAIEGKGEPGLARARLSQATAAFRVPPSAILLESSDVACVVSSSGTPVGVSIVGSSLGFTFFTTVAPLTGDVLLDPSREGKSCG